MRERWVAAATMVVAAMSGGAGSPAVVAAQDGAAEHRFVEGEYRGAEGSRRYRLFVPARPGGTTSAPPLVVFLHGCTQNAEDVARGTRLNEIAGALGVVVLYPEQGTDANPNRCWNWYDAGHQRRGEGEPALLAAMARAVAAEVGADPTRVSVAGISAGGAMALITAAAYPDRFAAAGTHSGMPIGAASSAANALPALRAGASPPPRAIRAAMGDRLRTLPLIVLHGDADEVVHPRNSDAIVAQWVEAFDLSAPSTTFVRGGAGDEPRSYQYDTYADASGTTVLEYWSIAGLGHAWSGGSPDGSYTDPRGPDASMELLRFLTSHRLASPPSGAGAP